MRFLKRTSRKFICISTWFLMVLSICIVQPVCATSNEGLLNVFYIIKSGGEHKSYIHWSGSQKTWNDQRDAIKKAYMEQYSTVEITVAKVTPGWCGVLYSIVKKNGHIKYHLSSDRTHSDAQETAREKSQSKYEDREIHEIVCSTKGGTASFKAAWISGAILHIPETIRDLLISSTSVGPIYSALDRSNTIKEVEQKVKNLKGLLKLYTDQPSSEVSDKIQTLYQEVATIETKIAEKVYTKTQSGVSKIDSVKIANKYYDRAQLARNMGQLEWFEKYLELAKKYDSLKESKKNNK